MEATRPGARIAWFIATQPPKECPTKCAGRSLSWASSWSNQAAQAAGGDIRARATLGFGSPGMSIPYTGPALASAATCGYQLEALPPAPWNSTTGSPPVWGR
jgi:hypothetical protein